MRIPGYKKRRSTPVKPATPEASCGSHAVGESTRRGGFQTRASRRVSALAIVLAACFASLTATDASVAASIPLHRDRVATESPQRDSASRGFTSGPSQRNLLGLTREAPFKLPLVASAIQGPRILKVLGIRVEFPLEDPDNPATTGRGRFDRRDTTTYFDTTGHHFDSAPHDRKYFEAHLRALDLYWNTVSNGLVSLQSTVYPLEPDSAYLMPDSMSYYGRDRGSNGGGVAFGLRRFVIDAARTASQNEPTLRFSDYDAVVIFHAGADRQSDIMRDSPEDLFAGFLRLDSTLILGGGSDSLVEAIIMPETEIQDGRITVLNGVMAHEFGHQLGLVDLYNTSNFFTQVGNFSLMDNNAADVGVTDTLGGRWVTAYGALPVFPDAWSRAYLGFVDVIEVFNANSVHVPAAEDLSPFPQVMRVPISSTEYYLIENRRVQIGGPHVTALRQDSTTFVILEPIDSLSELPTREYDYLLPEEGGLLIWHVDEGVAALDTIPREGFPEDSIPGDDIPNNFLANTLQWNPYRRFVRLIEADGIVHFGGFYSSGTGDRGDYFFLHNRGELSETTNPPAISNTGGSTGIRIFGISDPSNDMTFNVTIAGRLANFPVYAGDENGVAGAPIVTDMVRDDIGRWRYPGDGRPEIFAGYSNYILGWHWDGTPVGSDSITIIRNSFDATPETLHVHIVAKGSSGDSGWITPPMIGDFDGDEGFADLAAVSRTGRVYAWRMDSGLDGLFRLRFDTATTGRPSAPPVAVNRGTTTSLKDLVIPIEGRRFNVVSLLDGEVIERSFPGTIRGLAGTSDSNAVCVWRADSVQWFVGSLGDSGRHHAALGADSLLPPVLGDLNHDGTLEAVVANIAGRLWALETPGFTILPGFPVELGATPSASPVLADLDRDGHLEIIAAAGGRLYAYAYTGALIPNFPAVIGRVDSPDSVTGSPSVSDFGNSGRLSILTGGLSRAVYGFDGDGGEVSGFPRPLGGRLASSVAAAINSKDHRSAIFARADDGYLYVFEVPQPASPSRAIWPMVFRDALHTSTVGLEDLEPVKSYTQFFPTDSAFVYPNPARDQANVRYWLGEDARVNIRIFDLAGNLVREVGDIRGTGGVFNQPWIWECAGAASGVYFVRIEAVADGGGERKTVMCKMSIVH